MLTSNERVTEKVWVVALIESLGADRWLIIDGWCTVGAGLENSPRENVACLNFTIFSPVRAFGPGNGGGGGGDPGLFDTQTDAIARKELQDKLKNFSKSNCNKVFADVIEGYSTSGFVGEAKTTEFYAARNQPYASLTQNQVVGNGNKASLNNSLQFGQTARTIQGSLGAAVLLGPNFFSDTVPGQQNTLVHELLHVYTNGWSDPEIFDAFKDYGLKHINPGSGDITGWISTDCTKTPTGAN